MRISPVYSVYPVCPTVRVCAGVRSCALVCVCVWPFGRVCALCPVPVRTHLRARLRARTQQHRRVCVLCRLRLCACCDYVWWRGGGRVVPAGPPGHHHTLYDDMLSEGVI